MGIAVSPQIHPQVAEFLETPRKMLINGKWVSSISGKTFPTYNPATGEILAQVAEGDRQDIEEAVKAARKAFDQGPWRRMTASERGRLIWKLADLLDKNIDEFLGSGKPGFNFIGYQDKVYGVPTVLQGDSFAYLPEKTGKLDSYAALFDPKWKGYVALEDYNMIMQVTTITHRRKPVFASILSQVTPSTRNPNTNDPCVFTQHKNNGGRNQSARSCP